MYLFHQTISIKKIYLFHKTFAIKDMLFHTISKK